MKGVHFLISTLAILAFAPFLASAFDPSPLQDFCVALKDIKDGVFVNGKFCKDPNLTNANDFFSSGLQNPGDTQNQLGSNVTFMNVDDLAGLNTLGISMARIDIAPNGVNPPHTHPRASELFYVLEGTLYVGFVTSNGANGANGNRLFTKVLNKGDVFVFPFGLIHFQLNVGHVNAVALASFSSQQPGLITIANAVFGAKPPINPNVLTKAFQVDDKLVEHLQKQFGLDNNDDKVIEYLQKQFGEYLQKQFGLDNNDDKVVEYLQKQFGFDNN